MTSATVAAPAPQNLSSRVTPLDGLKQTMTLAWRTIVQVRHNPWELGDFTFQPILFVLMFTYVFGGAIAGDTDRYLSYMLPGMVAMNVVFVTMYVGTGLNTDITKGVFDRLQSLPIARWAPLAGRIIADQVKQGWSIFLVLVVGLILGYRFGSQSTILGTSDITNIGTVVGAIALLLVFALAFSWISVFIGVIARDPEQVQMIGFTALFPIAFVSSVFADPSTMPGWLQGFVKVNPISHMADATRSLLSGGEPAGTAVMWTLVTAVIIVVIFGPLSVWAFKRRV